MFDKSRKQGLVPTSAGPQLLSVAGVSVECNVSKRSVWRLIAAGKLRPVRIGRSVRIRREDVQALIEKGGTTNV